MTAARIGCPIEPIGGAAQAQRIGRCGAMLLGRLGARRRTSGPVSGCSRYRFLSGACSGRSSFPSIVS
jgi:hypothetical protein